VGAWHRAAAGAEDLLIVEVQRGGELREDDIERIADDFGRAA
jgi:mannose-6-phosphate isomerase-like protein (cupin superfamily)